MVIYDSYKNYVHYQFSLLISHNIFSTFVFLPIIFFCLSESPDHLYPLFNIVFTIGVISDTFSLKIMPYLTTYLYLCHSHYISILIFTTRIHCLYIYIFLWNIYPNVTWMVYNNNFLVQIYTLWRHSIYLSS